MNDRESNFYKFLLNISIYIYIYMVFGVWWGLHICGRPELHPTFLGHCLHIIK
jgi:hypothetical protein